MLQTRLNEEARTTGGNSDDDNEMDESFPNISNKKKWKNEDHYQYHQILI